MASGCIVMGMKINEIRNKMFSLSDLKGLISENVTTENINWINFFKSPENQKFLGDEYGMYGAKEFWGDRELRTAIARFPGSQYQQIEDDGQIPLLGVDTKKNIIKAFRKARLNYLELMQQNDQEPNPENAMSLLSKEDGEETPTKLLYNFFMQNGGASLSYSDDMNVNEALTRQYVDTCRQLADSANEYFTQNGNPIRKFDDMGLKIGSVTDPFLLFLFFYYFQYYERRGGNWTVVGKRNKLDDFIGNMEPGTVSEYVKFVFNEIGRVRFKRNYALLPNVFDTVLQYGKASTMGGKIYTALVNGGFTGDELSYARSMAYLQKYQEIMSIPVPAEDISFMSSVFNYEPDKLFDPLSKIGNGQIMAGLQKSCSNGSSDSLNKFIKPILTDKEEFESPAEQIFAMVRSFKNVLGLDFGKILGASGRNVLGSDGNLSPEKMELLLGPATIGIAKLEEDAASRGYSGAKVPQAINGLKELYMGEIKKTEDLRMWQILRRETDTKTQDEIFNFLLAISDQDTVWKQEYNRFEKQAVEREEGGLGLKSIDIMGKKQNGAGNEKVLCFEYQGEQHYHPVNVRPSDYQYTLFTAMREDILTKCGFSADETEGRKYYHGFESIDELFVKTVIIDTFKEYAKALQAALSERGNLGDKVIGRNFSLVSEGSSVKSVNVKALSTFTIKEALDYFIEVASKNPHNATIFENPPLKGVVPYLCSPCRFFDEIQTALDIERDRVKREVIAKRQENAGWSMAYVTPKVADTNSSPFTSDDYQYTLRLAGGKAEVFQWSQEGKAEMAQYLERMGFKTPEANGNNVELQESVNSLFQQIIREVINENAQ